MASKTYGTFGEAVNDPQSNIARFIRKGQTVMTKNERVIREWMATGLSREEAWAKALSR